MGCSVGYFGMGVLYEEGKGVEEDLEKAIDNYEKAAELGNNEAKEKLDDLYC